MVILISLSQRIPRMDDPESRIITYQYVPHKAVAAEVSKIANYRRLAAVNHGSQSKSTDGSKSGWRPRGVVVVVVVLVVAM